MGEHLMMIKLSRSTANVSLSVSTPMSVYEEHIWKGWVKVKVVTWQSSMKTTLVRGSLHKSFLMWKWKEIISIPETTNKPLSSTHLRSFRVNQIIPTNWTRFNFQFSWQDIKKAREWHIFLHLSIEIVFLREIESFWLSCEKKPF